MVNMVEETEDDHVHALRVGGEPGREVCRKQIELLLRTSMRYQRLERPLRGNNPYSNRIRNINRLQYVVTKQHELEKIGDGTADLTG